MKEWWEKTWADEVNLESNVHFLQNIADAQKVDKPFKVTLGDFYASGDTIEEAIANLRHFIELDIKYKPMMHEHVDP